MNDAGIVKQKRAANVCGKAKIPAVDQAFEQGERRSGGSTGGSHGKCATLVWRSRAQSSGPDFWHASGLVNLPQAACRPGAGKAMPALAGWGYCVSLARSWAGIGLAELIAEEFDPGGFDLPGTMGKWIRVRATNSGLETTMEVKK
jgi:hypothetical protein